MDRANKIWVVRAQIDAAESMLEHLRGKLRELEGDVCPYSFAHTQHWCEYEGCREE